MLVFMSGMCFADIIAQLDLNDGDMIDVYQQQLGGSL